ncbi:hypothetical protein [Streptomyces sp. NPDC058657]|uniref:hypothetical protein n=1 Tax=unclassified Streptomyces TaxID=2593676 RepID=UPI003661E8EC
MFTRTGPVVAERVGWPGRAGDAEAGRGLRLVRALGGEITWCLREHCGKTVRVRIGP